MRGSETFTIVWSSAARNMVASTPASTSALRRGGSVMPGGRSSPGVSTARPMASMPRYPSPASAASTRAATSSGTQPLQRSRRVCRKWMALSPNDALFSSSHSSRYV